VSHHGASGTSLGSGSARAPPETGQVPATRRSEATPRPRVGCPPPSAAGLIMMVRHEVHGQNELCCPGFLASGSPPGQEERLVTSAGDAVKMPGHGRGPLGHGQASSNRTSTGPQPRSHPQLIGPRATKLSPQPAPAGMASTCALLLDLGQLEVGSRLTMNQGLQLRSSTSAAIRPARGSSEEVPQPPSAADPARGAQMAVKGPRGAQERSGADRLTKRWDPLRGSAVREELAAKGQYGAITLNMQVAKIDTKNDPA